METLDSARAYTRFEREARRRYHEKLTWHVILAIYGSSLTAVFGLALWLHFARHVAMSHEPWPWELFAAGIVAAVKGWAFILYDYKHGP